MANCKSDDPVYRWKAYAIFMLVIIGMMSFTYWMESRKPKPNLIQTTYNTNGMSTVKFERVRADGLTEQCETTFVAFVTQDAKIGNTRINTTCAPCKTTAKQPPQETSANHE